MDNHTIDTMINLLNIAKIEIGGDKELHLLTMSDLEEDQVICGGEIINQGVNKFVLLYSSK